MGPAGKAGKRIRRRKAMQSGSVSHRTGADVPFAKTPERVLVTDGLPVIFCRDPDRTALRDGRFGRCGLSWAAAAKLILRIAADQVRFAFVRRRLQKLIRLNLLLSDAREIVYGQVLSGSVEYI